MSTSTNRTTFASLRARAAGDARIAVAASSVAAFLLPGTAGAATIDGALVARQLLTFDLAGPPATETDDAPNLFLDMRLEVTFTSPAGIAHRVPGFFAGNGLGHGTGNVWRALHARRAGHVALVGGLRRGRRHRRVGRTRPGARG